MSDVVSDMRRALALDSGLLATLGFKLYCCSITDIFEDRGYLECMVIARSLEEAHQRIIARHSGDSRWTVLKRCSILEYVLEPGLVHDL